MYGRNAFIIVASYSAGLPICHICMRMRGIAGVQIIYLNVPETHAPGPGLTTSWANIGFISILVRLVDQE